jgi:hypothetical protein
MFKVNDRVRIIGIFSRKHGTVIAVPRRAVFEIKLDSGVLETYPLHYLCPATA